MSAFGDNNFKSDVYGNLSWIISHKPLTQIRFINENIMNLIEGEWEDLDSNVLEYVNERNISREETLEYLSEIYSYLVQNYQYL